MKSIESIDDSKLTILSGEPYLISDVLFKTEPDEYMWLEETLWHQELSSWRDMQDEDCQS